MPYVSQAQRGMFHVLLKEGKISPATVKEWDQASKGMTNLPQHVQKRKAARRAVVNGR